MTAAANESEAISVSSEALLKSICTDAMLHAHGPADVARLATYCDPARNAVEAHETAWHAAQAALVAVKADPEMPDEAALLADRAATLTTTRKALARALEGTR